ncbi:MAG: bifunctional lysine ketoglutarate reductase /saccharopine dehydrogenase family protein [Nitrososphaerales archaeon]
MQGTQVKRIGVRREDRSRWERRAPVTPDIARYLRDEHGIEVFVQPAPIRAFTEAEFEAGGAVVCEDLALCPIVFAVKEIPSSFFRPGGAYMFFSHVIKGQPRNMPMLRRLMELGCTLIDYEKVVDDAGRRLIFFGRYAGLAGMLETLRALGQRLRWEGIPNPFEAIRHAHEYRDLAEAKEAVANVGEEIRREGLPPQAAPLTVGVTGYGNVARGAWEILNLLPIEIIEPSALSDIVDGPGASRHVVFGTTFKEQHIVEPIEGEFDCRKYYECPDNYRPIFEKALAYLSVIVNGIYWDARYPRVVTKAGLQTLWASGQPRLKVIGDISCDIEGSIECTVKTTEPDEPCFVYNPVTGEARDGCEGDGLVVMAVDILPSELPRDASEDFSSVLKDLIPALAAADFTAPFEELALPAPIKRAVIVHRGELTPDFAYLHRYLE